MCNRGGRRKPEEKKDIEGSVDSRDCSRASSCRFIGVGTIRGIELWNRVLIEESVDVDQATVCGTRDRIRRKDLRCDESLRKGRRKYSQSWRFAKSCRLSCFQSWCFVLEKSKLCGWLLIAPTDDVEPGASFQENHR